MTLTLFRPGFVLLPATGRPSRVLLYNQFRTAWCYGHQNYTHRLVELLLSEIHIKTISCAGPSWTTKLNGFHLAYSKGEVIESDRLKRELINLQLLFLTCRTSTYSLLKLSYNYIRETYRKHTSLHGYWIAYKRGRQGYIQVMQSSREEYEWKIPQLTWFFLEKPFWNHSPGCFLRTREDDWNRF